MEDEKRADNQSTEPKRSDEVEAKELSEDEMDKAAGGDPGYTWGPYWQQTGGH